MKDKKEIVLKECEEILIKKGYGGNLKPFLQIIEIALDKMENKRK